MNRTALSLAAAGLLAVVLLLNLAYPAAAVSSIQIEPTSVTVTGSAQPIDVVVLLDDSGSMATCWPWPQDRPPFEPPCGPPSSNPPSDPGALRYTAARLLLQLADAEDRVAVVRFDSTAGGVGELGALQPVGGPENRQRLIASLQPPTSYYERGYTRIDLGLEQAAAFLEGASEPGRNRYVLLLTDGEPSQQAGVDDQRGRIAAQLEQMRAAGVLVFPVVLCNPSAGCAGDFLAEQFPNGELRQAKSAPELLRVFSEVLAAMKPDRSLIGGRGSPLDLTAREAQAVRQLAIVAPSGELTAVRRDDVPVLPRSELNDGVIEVAVVDGADLTAGRWQAETASGSGFAVVQADSYPELLNPPPSVANSPASVRYYPAGKAPLILARGVGPAAGEPLLYNGEIELQPLGEDGLAALLPDEEPRQVRLQLGSDTAPLQLTRSFVLEPRSDLPQLAIVSPLPGNPGLREDGRSRLQVGFDGGSGVGSLTATVFVTDQTDDENGRGRLVHQADMRCTERLCSDESFTPGDGRRYQVIYVLQGEANGVRFSDWGQTDLVLPPAIYLRGLPGALDLAQMPADGWPIELSAGTTEEIGALSAALVLLPVGGEDPVTGVTLDFSEEVPESGAVQTRLKVEGLETLRPGDYVGELRLQATNPTGRPMEIGVRPGSLLPVTFSVPRPLARLEAQSLDFGAVRFDTSPNFRLDQELLLPIDFAGQPFPLTAALAESSCPGLAVAAGDVRQDGGGSVLPLRLTSSGPLPPGACNGVLRLSGPDADYDVTPAELTWRSRVDAVEWSIVSSDLALGDLQDAGSRAAADLLVRFNGKTPFIVELQEVAAEGAAGDGAVTLGEADLEMPPVEVTGSAGEDGLYRVPIALVARRTLPHDPLSGSVYAGSLRLGIAGLPEAAQEVHFTLRSPSIPQRYIFPVIGPVYSMPWVLCTAPLTLLLLLVAVARLRSRGFDESELEEAAAAATRVAAASLAVEPAPPPEPAPFVPVSSAGGESVWGRSEWGTPLSVEEGRPLPVSNGSGDPWSSAW